jgi:hypothetical protein
MNMLELHNRLEYVSDNLFSELPFDDSKIELYRVHFRSYWFMLSVLESTAIYINMDEL